MNHPDNGEEFARAVMERVAAVKSDRVCAPLPEEWPAYKAQFFSDQQQQGQPISPNAAPSDFASAAPGYAQPAIVMHQPSAPHYGYGGSSTGGGSGTAVAPAASLCQQCGVPLSAAFCGGCGTRAGAAPTPTPTIHKEAGDGALPSYKAMLRQMSEV